jgi:2-phosphoglycerate kinase
MIYLIGGPPRCGKTKAAQRLAALLPCSWVSVDSLATVIAAYIPEDEQERRYPDMAGDKSNDERYALYTPAAMVARYQTRAATVWQGLRAFIDHAQRHERDLILEGYQIEPRFVREVTPVGSDTGIRAVFLYKRDCGRILAGLKQNADKLDWARHQTRDDATFHKIAEMISTYSTYVYAEAAKYGLVSFSMDSTDGSFDSRLAEIIDFLLR